MRSWTKTCVWSRGIRGRDLQVPSAGARGERRGSVESVGQLGHGRTRGGALQRHHEGTAVGEQGEVLEAAVGAAVRQARGRRTGDGIIHAGGVVPDVQAGRDVTLHHVARPVDLHDRRPVLVDQPEVPVSSPGDTFGVETVRVVVEKGHPVGCVRRRVARDGKVRETGHRDTVRRGDRDRLQGPDLRILHLDAHQGGCELGGR